MSNIRLWSALYDFCETKDYLSREKYNIYSYEREIEELKCKVRDFKSKINCYRDGVRELVHYYGELTSIVNKFNSRLIRLGIGRLGSTQMLGGSHVARAA